MSNSIFLLFISLTAIILDQRFANATECYSCLSHCKILPDGRIDMNTCDCTGNQTCTAQNCFVKVELFSAESVAIVQKGCANNEPSGSGCHFAGQPESIHWQVFEFIAKETNLNDYEPQKLPLVECCECSGPSGEKCPEDKCARTCRGNYCLIDFDGVEQGCGVGLPRLKNFLRIQNYTDLQGTSTCARYMATQTTTVHGCVCTSPSGHCNQVNQSLEYQLKNVINRRENDENYCYSLHQKSKKPFSQDIFKKMDKIYSSETCQGHYCFISMTSSELAVENGSLSNGQQSFIGVSRSRYEILAGCVKVDDDKKVSIGCTTEFLNNSSEPISRHCICESHLCNYFNLLGESGDKLTEKSLITNQSHDHHNEEDFLQNTAPVAFYVKLFV
ncbi:hypothetical protein M3Y97_00872100 [Aphelenchoides bicaudatus]|nr:hypothetical protein M3Y97_00872100 [Aphelenchoides bicaudatus]